MRLPILQFWQAVRSSYWFVPSMMAIGAIVLGALIVWLDTGIAANLFEDISWYQKSKPEGARAVLSAIAGSMITVAGVVFSITIVAISYAANQYGPRVLTNFMSDRGNQVTLGTFIATFLYSLVVLRTIYSGDTDFVPQLGVFVAMLLAGCSIAVLIYFIHHVPESIHVNHVASRIGRQLIKSVEQAFPAGIGEPPEHPEPREEIVRASEQLESSDAAEIQSCSAGYIQAMDEDRLLGTACKHGIIVRLLRTPGDFVYIGRPFALAWPAEKVCEEAEDDLRSSYGVGDLRTPFQDLNFLVDELVDVCARAMSTGVNDPFTASTCVDWMTAGAAAMASREPVSAYRLDDDGELRLIVPVGSFGQMVERGFGAIRAYVAHDVIAASHTADMLASLAERCRSKQQLQCVREQVSALVDLARDKLDPPEFARLESAARAASRAIGEALDKCWPGDCR